MNSNRKLFRFKSENEKKHSKNKKRVFSHINVHQQDFESDFGNDLDTTISSKRLKQSLNLINEEDHAHDLYSDESHFSSTSSKRTSFKDILETCSPLSIENALKLESLFKKENSEKVSSTMSTSELFGSQSPSSSSSSSSSSGLIDSFEINLNLKNDFLAQSISRDFSFRAIRSFKYNLDDLSLLKKETIYFLIERNQLKNIISPFDQFSYFRMKKNCVTEIRQSKSSKHNYNYKSVKDLKNLLEKLSYNPLNKKYLEKNNFLSNCVSQMLMPFFFDIFQATELKSFSHNLVDIMLLLRRTYKTEIYLKYELLIGYFVENLIWNCVILYKYNFNQDSHSRMGYLNFYLSFICIVIHLNYVLSYSQNENNENFHRNVDYTTKIENLNFFLELFLHALIQNGLFKHSDYVQFKKFFLDKTFPLNKIENLIFNTNTHIADSQLYSKSNCFEKTYLNFSLRNLRNISMKTLPMKLKNLCRIKIKQSMNERYDPNTIDKLNLTNSIKEFLTFDHEIQYLLKLANIQLNKMK